MSNQSRRDFLKTSAAVSAVAFAGHTAYGVQDEKPDSANEQINFACIGVGGKGGSDSKSAGNAGNVVAIADCDDRTLKKAGVSFRSAEKFNDFREMLDQMGDKIDAVTVSTPDHTHAVAAAAAMNLGKHCFCQKPLTWSVGEARHLKALADKHSLATQMGNQGTATNGLRESVEAIRAGNIGDVKEVHVWTNRPIWPQGVSRPEGEEAPAHVHWDLFLGPAAYREYSPAYHPFKWRGWLDFGTGALGDMACHTMNMPVMALGLFDPVKIDVVENSGVYEGETYPAKTTLKYTFAPTDERGEVVMYWYDGGLKPDASLIEGSGKKMNRSGAVVVGDKGKLYSDSDYGASYVIYGGGETQLPEQSLPRSPGHFEEFARAIRGGEKAMSNFDYAVPLTETVLLGNLAVRMDQSIEWDAKAGKASNADASKLLMRDYRDGWSLAGYEE